MRKLFFCVTMLLGMDSANAQSIRDLLREPGSQVSAMSVKDDDTVVVLIRGGNFNYFLCQYNLADGSLASACVRLQ